MTRKRSDSQYIAQESIYAKETNDWYPKMLKCAESFVRLQKCIHYTQDAGSECHCLEKHLSEDFIFISAITESANVVLYFFLFFFILLC